MVIHNEGIEILPHDNLLEAPKGLFICSCFYLSMIVLHLEQMNLQVHNCMKRLDSYYIFNHGTFGCVDAFICLKTINFEFRFPQSQKDFIFLY